jgi:1-aminocyclopropane-1-carboxylate deaminase/D-cysteine desulfhydrase-like pyridoxal-dependent ACC family enzyme
LWKASATVLKPARSAEVRVGMQTRMDWERIEARLEDYWAALHPVPRLLSQWQPSRRYPELTYVREDRVGHYKERKYASLIPWMIQQGFRHVRLRGSSHSANILMLSLLLRQHGIQASYVLEGREGPPVGNGLLNRLVLGHRFLTESPGEEADWEVPEGANCPQALAGSLGIAGSLIYQALQHRHLPEDIYIDSGTGFTAAALILGLGYFQCPCHIHVVSMTGQKRPEIEGLLRHLTEEYQRLFDGPPQEQEYSVTLPPIAPSFGSVPSRVFEEVQDMAQSEGILTDPLYSAKLSLTYQASRNPTARALMFVSGGTRDLLGFQGPLQKWLGKHDRTH